MLFRVLFCIVCVFINICTSQDGVQQRYEFKYSFKGPSLTQTDKSIPFWNHTGGGFVFRDVYLLSYLY